MGIMEKNMAATICKRVYIWVRVYVIMGYLELRTHYLGWHASFDA